jgi:hypothetical protein
VLETHPDIRASHVLAPAQDGMSSTSDVDALLDALERLGSDEAHRLLDAIENDDDGGSD